MATVMLTTTDNEWNPFTNYDEWYNRDLELSRENERIDTCGYIALIARTSDAFTDEENDREIERAINEIIRFDFKNIYVKVKK